jgi:hypothetical protein
MCPPYIHEATEVFDVHFFVYSLHFWNKFIVDGTLGIKDYFQYNLALALAQAGFLILI